MNEYQMPSDFNGYLKQLFDAIMRAKETGDTSFAEKAFEMIIDDINGAKTYVGGGGAMNPYNVDNSAMSDKLNEVLNNYKRLF
jgi:hypothetical protein